MAYVAGRPHDGRAQADSMDLLTHQLLNEAEVNEMRDSLLADESSWEDGKKTAGYQAAQVKNNLQLNRSSELAQKTSQQVINRMLADKLVKSFSLSRRIHGVMFSRTGEGQGYGMHVDNAYMQSGRSDLSFTLFLSKPENYEGGSLCIQTIQDNKDVKLPAGHVVIYPSTSLHAVETVTSGERLVCVGWIQSYVSSNEERSILFGLDAGARGLLAKHGRSPELDLVFQAYTNLLRRFGN